MGSISKRINTYKSVIGEFLRVWSSDNRLLIVIALFISMSGILFLLSENDLLIALGPELFGIGFTVVGLDVVIEYTKFKQREISTNYLVINLDLTIVDHLVWSLYEAHSSHISISEKDHTKLDSLLELYEPESDFYSSKNTSYINIAIEICLLSAPFIQSIEKLSPFIVNTQDYQLIYYVQYLLLRYDALKFSTLVKDHTILSTYRPPNPQIIGLYIEALEELREYINTYLDFLHHN